MVEAPTHNLTDKQLKLSYWYISHKLKIRRYTTIFLIVAAVLLWLLFGWQTADFIANYNFDQYRVGRLLFTGSPYLELLNSRRPQELIISDSRSFSEDNGRYDFLALTKNPNNDWLVTFDYRFSDGDKEGSYRHSFAMPGEEKYLMDLGHEVSASKLEIINQYWKRVEKVESTINSRLRFEVSDEKLYAGNAAAGEPNRVVFKMTNNSAFGFWNVGAQVFLYSAGELVSINYIDVKQFRAGEARQIEVDWNYRLPGIDSIEVRPELNAFDDSNIMKPGD